MGRYPSEGAFDEAFDTVGLGVGLPRPVFGQGRAKQVQHITQFLCVCYSAVTAYANPELTGNQETKKKMHMLRPWSLRISANESFVESLLVKKRNTSVERKECF